MDDLGVFGDILTMLGWIFFFPIMLCYIIYKHSNERCPKCNCSDKYNGFNEINEGYIQLFDAVMKYKKCSNCGFMLGINCDVIIRNRQPSFRYPKKNFAVF